MLLEILQLVRLATLPKRLGHGDSSLGLDILRDFSDELSLGEQQRLGFARILVARPKFVVLDEATSALDLANEDAMYTAMGSLPGLTYMSVGHRPSLAAFHKKKLVLEPGGGGQVLTLVEEQQHAALTASLT